MAEQDTRIAYNCAQVARKLAPVVGNNHRLFVRSEATGVTFEIVGVETRQCGSPQHDSSLFEEDVYLIARVVRPPYHDADEDEVEE